MLRPLGRTAAAVVVTTLAGCGAAGHAASPPRTGAGSVQSLTIRVTDGLRFEPSALTVHPGRVRLTLVDTGAYPHNIAFASLGRTSRSVSGSPGEQRTTLDLTLNRPGTYRFVCTYHSSAGMAGVLRVR